MREGTQAGAVGKEEAEEPDVGLDPTPPDHALS